jgi:hypothetical protein
MIYGLTLWIALTVIVMAMFAYRFFIARREDDTVHLADGEVPMIQEQTVLAARLDRIDRLRNTLTFVDLAFGLALLAVFSYNALRTSGVL